MNMTKVSAEQLEQHVRHLTVDIGVRLAGSTAEREAATYLAETSGTFYHHRRDDTLDKLDFSLAARHLDAVAAFLVKLAREENTSIDTTDAFSATEQTEIKGIWETIYGGWTGFES